MLVPLFLPHINKNGYSVSSEFPLHSEFYWQYWFGQNDGLEMFIFFATSEQIWKNIITVQMPLKPFWL